MAKAKTIAKKTPRQGDRRRLLDEAEFRRLVETGRVKESDRRSWMERRKRKP
jgi:hypothetical protein